MLLWKKKLAWTPITTKFGDFSNSGFFNPHSNFFCIVQINKEITRGVFCTLPLLILKIILNLGIIFFWTHKMCSNLQGILPIKKKIVDACLVPKVWCLQELGQRWCCWRSWWGSQYLSPSFTLLCALQGGFLRIQLKLNTALLSTVRPSVCSCVTGVTSQLFSIIWWFSAWKPFIFWSHVILAISVHEPSPLGPCRPTP